ncbi:hypothetical protein ACQP2T_22615 [Nonomuraea sp. CA-143628]|uniref:hypothetical protein n=1 Tax=Nonomuraea sp. CA-143628 TaxID=3239997 RepID=UPI003D8D5F7A
MLTIDYQSEPYVPGEGRVLPSRDLVFPQVLLDRYGAKVLDPATVVVDAWRALRTLRRALRDFPDTPQQPGPAGRPKQTEQAGRTEQTEQAGRTEQVGQAGLAGLAGQAGQADVKELLSGIALDHLLAGSAFVGVGVGAALDIGGEPATSGHGMPGGAYATPTAGYARTPVNVAGGPPARRPAEHIGGRRPVMVIPDTGLPKQRHAWFRPVTDPDTFLSVSDAAQQRFVVRGARTGSHDHADDDPGLRGRRPGEHRPAGGSQTRARRGRQTQERRRPNDRFGVMAADLRPERGRPDPRPEPGPADLRPELGPADHADRRDRLAGLLQEARDALNLIAADLTPLRWQVVRRQGLDQEAAEDVIQTTWLRV